MERLIEIPTCACGQRMLVTNVADVFVCLNCDGVQAQEVGENAKPRKKTQYDKQFDAEMERRMEEWFPTQKDGGK